MGRILLLRQTEVPGYFLDFHSPYVHDFASVFVAFDDDVPVTGQALRSFVLGSREATKRAVADYLHRFAPDLID